MRQSGKNQERTDYRQFYRESMELLKAHDVPFLVGGAYAMGLYSDVHRETKDFDLYVRADDVDRVLTLFHREGFHVERPHPHWLAKIFNGKELIDVIHRAGNGLCDVDDSWFARARAYDVLGTTAKITAPEEMIWMKAYIMERERYDGADVAHLLLSCADKIDWKHLLARFGPDWRVLLSHLVLFGFVYPSERHRLPPALIEDLAKKLCAEQFLPAGKRICRGTLLSRAQYLTDIQEWGFRDARLEARCHVTAKELEAWTADIPL